MDGERCDMELAPSTPQPAAGAEGVEMFTTPMQQLPVDNTHLLTSRQENKDGLKDLGKLLMDRMLSMLDKHLMMLALQPAGQKENAARLALQPAEQKKCTAEEVAVKVSAVTATASAQAPAAVVLSTAVALAPKDILKYPEQVHQDEVVQTAYAASAGTQEVACTVAAVGEPPTAFTPATAPGEMMDSKEAADVDPWITQFLKQLDAKGEVPREQPVQLKRMKEQKVVQSTRDHKVQHEQIQRQSVGVAKLGRLAEISGQEALQQAVQHTTGELSTRRLFKYGDVEEKPQRHEQQLLLEVEEEKLRGNDFTKEIKEHKAQLTAKQPAAQLTKEAARQQALGIASAEEQGEAAELAWQEAQQQAGQHKNKELAAGQVDSLNAYPDATEKLQAQAQRMQNKKNKLREQLANAFTEELRKADEQRLQFEERNYEVMI